MRGQSFPVNENRKEDGDDEVHPRYQADRGERPMFQRCQKGVEAKEVQHPHDDGDDQWPGQGAGCAFVPPALLNQQREDRPE